jgi:hypothetical protein
VRNHDGSDSATAGGLAAAAFGRTPLAVHRFSTGWHHYVFEVTFEDRAPVVVRIAAEHSRSAMVGALKVSRLLRPLGVPLPEIISKGVRALLRLMPTIEPARLRSIEPNR